MLRCDDGGWWWWWWCRYIGLVEDDYEWITTHLVRIANTFCQGRIVSVLEGGYRIQGGVVSPFARSVAAHVRTSSRTEQLAMYSCMHAWQGRPIDR